MTTSYANVSRASQPRSAGEPARPRHRGGRCRLEGGRGLGAAAAMAAAGKQMTTTFCSGFGRNLPAPGIDWAASSKFKITSRDGDPEISWLDPQAPAPAAEADTKSRSPPESWID